MFLVIVLNLEVDIDRHDFGEMFVAECFYSLYRVKKELKSVSFMLFFGNSQALDI